MTTYNAMKPIKPKKPQAGMAGYVYQQYERDLAAYNRALASYNRQQAAAASAPAPTTRPPRATTPVQPPGHQPPPSTPSNPTTPPPPASTAPVGMVTTPNLFGINAQTIVPYEVEPGLDYWLSDPAPYYEGNNLIGYIRKWQWIYNGSPAGLEQTRGDITRHWDRLSSGTADCRFPDHVFLPLDLETATSPDPTGNLNGIHWIYLFDTLIAGLGSGANVSLINLNGTPAAITYTPSAVLSCLAEIVIGGATTAKRMVVGRVGSAAQIISDASGTVDATMHANTASLWWLCQTVLPDRPIIFQAGNTVWKLSITAATGDAPTALIANRPAGGRFIDLIARGGGPMRIYVLEPKTTNTSGAAVHGSVKPCRVVHYSQAGTDVQEMTPFDFLGMDDIIDAAPWRDGIVVTDYFRVVFNNDESKEDLGIFRDREPDTDRQLRVVGFMPRRGAALRVLINSVATSNAPSGTNTIQWVEEYDPRTHAWQPVSEKVTLSTTGVLGVIGVGGLPYNHVTGEYHWYTDGSWYRQFDCAYGHNPYTEVRQTFGAYPSTGKLFNTTATLKTSLFSFKGIEPWPKVVSRFGRIRDNQGGGPGAYVTYTLGGVSSTFYDVGYSTHERADVPDREDHEDNESVFYQGQLQIDLSQWTDITDNLIAWWSLEEASGTADDSFSSNDLTETSGTIPSTTGKVGNSRLFAAADTEYLALADNAALSAGDVALDIVCWVYIVSTPSSGNTMGIVGKWASGDLEYLLFLDNTGGTIRFKFSVRNTGDSTTSTATASTFGTPSTATWYMLHAYHDPTGNVIGISVNAGPNDTTATTGGVRDGTAAFEIGRHTASNYFDGRVDEVAIWKHATTLLTSDQVANLYNGGYGVSYLGIRRKTPNASGFFAEGYAFIGIPVIPPKFIDDEALGIPDGPLGRLAGG